MVTLVLSADESTWPADDEVLFLGDWCRLPDREDKWRFLQGSVVRPFGITIEERVADFRIVTELKAALLLEVSECLSTAHGVEYSVRFWQILIGDWLSRYVDTVYNRMATLDSCLQNYDIDCVLVSSCNKNSFECSNSMNFIAKTSDDGWNAELFRRIFKQIPRLNERAIYQSDVSYKQNSATATDPASKSVIRTTARHATKFLSSLFVRSNESFILNSYLPRRAELRLFAKLRQLPRAWDVGYSGADFEPTASADHDLRLRLRDQLRRPRETDIEAVLYETIFYILPRTYLEGFDEVVETAASNGWPSRPKFIFTSNSYDFDDVFKIYAALQVELNQCPYIIGCHGNGFFNHYQCPSNSEQVADRFLTWGWDFGHPSHLPASIFKTVGMAKPVTKSDGNLVITQMSPFHRITTWDVFGEYSVYFEKLVKAVGGLDPDVRGNTVIKIREGPYPNSFNTVDAWTSRFADVAVTQQGGSLIDMAPQARLLVNGYDSTGLSECISLGVPVMAIFQLSCEQINPACKDAYDALLEVGIMHDTPESLAAKINEVWEDVESWWSDPKVLAARDYFGARHARVSDAPIDELAGILLSVKPRFDQPAT